MDRLTSASSKSYWQLSVLVVAIVAVTARVSVWRYDTIRLPRKHVLGYVDLLRDAARCSVKSSQDSNPIQSFIDANNAQIMVNVAKKFLTPDQVRTMLHVEIEELYEHVCRQHDRAARRMVEYCTEETKPLRFGRLGGGALPPTIVPRSSSAPSGATTITPSKQKKVFGPAPSHRIR
jgi:hypothetical protein